MISFIKFIFAIVVLQCMHTTAIAQTCTQPGSLLSVKNSYRSHLEYIVFTFIDPYASKGELHKADKSLFSQQPSMNSTNEMGEQFYTITFTNAFSICDTKNQYVVPQAKIINIKLLQKTEGKITYIFSLAKNAKITSHTAYNYHGVHIVKIRVE